MIAILRNYEEWSVVKVQRKTQLHKQQRHNIKGSTTHGIQKLLWYPVIQAINCEFISWTLTFLSNRWHYHDYNNFYHGQIIIYAHDASLQLHKKIRISSLTYLRHVSINLKKG